MTHSRTEEARQEPSRLQGAPWLRPFGHASASLAFRPSQSASVAPPPHSAAAFTIKGTVRPRPPTKTLRLGPSSLEPPLPQEPTGLAWPGLEGAWLGVNPLHTMLPRVWLWYYFCHKEETERERERKTMWQRATQSRALPRWQISMGRESSIVVMKAWSVSEEEDLLGLLLTAAPDSHRTACQGRKGSWKGRAKSYNCTHVP